MRDRARRTRVTATVLVAALVGSTLLGALASLAGRRSSVEIPAQGPWTVVVTGDLRPVAACTQDRAVVDGYLSADDPSSGGSLVLAVDAETADVERVVRCLAQGVDPAGISVVTSPVEERVA